MGSTVTPEQITTSLRRLQEAFADNKAEILTPDSEGYAESIKRWSLSCEKNASAVVKPTTTEQVSLVIKELAGNGVPFVVLCSGHSTSGSSSIEDGVVVDLRLMNRVEVDPEARTVTAEGGCTWAMVDSALHEHGLATVGGTVNHTGIGGLTLGGGYGWLTGRHGLVIDNLVRARVVLADGSAVTASEDEHPDLFWALRGAGQDFGCVTEFTYRAHEQRPDVFAGMLAVSFDELPRIVDFLNRLHEIDDPDASCLCVWTELPGTDRPSFLVPLVYNGPEEKATEVFGPLLELPHLFQKVGMMSLPEANALLAEDAPYGQRRLFGAACAVFPLKPEVIREAVEKWYAAAKPLGAASGMMGIEFMSSRAIRSVGLTDTAFANRGDYVNMSAIWRWDDPALDGEVRALNRSLTKWLKENGGWTGQKQGSGVYGNHDDISSHDADALFGVNAKRLREIKRRYDPTGTFHGRHKLL